MLARRFAPLQIPALRAIRRQGYSQCADAHPSPLHPPPPPASNLKSFPRGPRASHRSRHHAWDRTSVSALHRGSNLSLLLLKVKGETMKETRRPCNITSSTLLKQHHSHNAKQKLGDGGRRWEPEISQNSQQGHKPLEIRDLWKCTQRVIPFIGVAIR